jgi:hypothetical protein
MHNSLEQRWLTPRLRAMQIDEKGRGFHAFRHSLVTEGMHRIDVAGSPRRYEASRTSRRREHEACRHEGEWVVRLQAVELAANQIGESKGQQTANGKSVASEKDNLAHDHP